MINIRGSRDYLVKLESVAMTDIVMNMFIFFFISFSLIYTFNPAKISKIEVRLPRASAKASSTVSEKVVLSVTKEGRFFLNASEVKASGIRSALMSKLREDPALGVLLKVDGSARFDNVVKALDVINELNIRKVGVAAIGRDGASNDERITR